MRKLSLGLLFAMMISVLTSCGFEQTSGKEKLEITKEGIITATLVEPFDKDYYNIDELTKMVHLEIEQYNQETGMQGITLDSLELIDGNCVAIMTFQNAEDYSLYNEVPFFVGTVQEAIDKGIDLDVILTEEGKDTTIGRDEIEQLEDYQLVVWYGDMPVVIPDRIRYYSEGLQVVDSKNREAQISNIKEIQDSTSAEENVDVTGNEKEELAGPFYLIYK